MNTCPTRQPSERSRLRGRPTTLLLASALALSVLWTVTPAQANHQRWYGIAREYGAETGSKETRWVVKMNHDCDKGFVLQAIWQGTADGTGWIEGDTSFCEQGYAGRAFSWAECYPTGGGDCSYDDGIYRRGVSTQSNVWTAHAYGTVLVDGRRFYAWQVKKDDTVLHRSSRNNPRGNNNYADVGTEAMSSSGYIQGHYRMSLRRRSLDGTWYYWSGRDYCTSDTNVGAHWNADTEFHVGMNSSVSDAC